MLVVIVKCVSCGYEKEVKAGEVPKDEVPMCDRCFMPMVPKKAVNKIQKGGE